RRPEDPSVLDMPIWVQQSSPDDPDLLAVCVFEHRIKPIRLDDLDIVVEEEQVLSTRLRRGKVVETRPVEPFLRLDDLIGVGAQPPFPPRLLLRNIFDADDFKISIGGLAAQRLDARLD